MANASTIFLTEVSFPYIGYPFVHSPNLGPIPAEYVFVLISVIILAVLPLVFLLCYLITLHLDAVIPLTFMFPATLAGSLSGGLTAYYFFIGSLMFNAIRFLYPPYVYVLLSTDWFAIAITAIGGAVAGYWMQPMREYRRSLRRHVRGFR